MEMQAVKEIEKERLKTIQRMGITMSHEINNPLAGIVGNIDLLLLGEDLHESARDRLNKIKSLSFRIRDIVRKMAEITEPVVTLYDRQTEMIDIRMSSASGVYEYVT